MLIGLNQKLNSIANSDIHINGEKIQRLNQCV